MNHILLSHLGPVLYDHSRDLYFMIRPTSRLYCQAYDQHFTVRPMTHIMMSDLGTISYCHTHDPDVIARLMIYILLSDL